MSRSAKEWSSPQTALAYLNVADNLPQAIRCCVNGVNPGGSTSGSTQNSQGQNNNSQGNEAGSGGGSTPTGDGFGRGF
jgi:hypothetical protein